MTRLLLDSHAVIWWLFDRPELGESAREAIANADEVFVSVVTPWELGIKIANGKLTLHAPLDEVLDEEGFQILPIKLDHVLLAPALPPHHRDPFDRMLISQAMCEQLTLVTADPQINKYTDVSLLVVRGK